MHVDAPDEPSESDDGIPSIRRLEFDVSWPPEHVAAYLVDGPEPILIDAGTPGEAGRASLDTGLERAGYAPTDVEHVLVTHPHVDHVGQLSTLREAGATIHAPRAALDYFETGAEPTRSTVRSVARSVGYDGDTLATVVEDTRSSLERNRTLLEAVDARPIDPTAPFSVGGRRFVPIETPGHQIHHLCFEATVDGERTLFSGDALVEPFRPGALHVWLDRGAYESVEALSVAMDRLEGTTATTAFPGHGPVFRDPSEVVDLTRDRIDSLLERTLSALEAVEPATPLSVAERRSGDLHHTVQVLDVVGALGTLERDGRVGHEERDGVRYYRTA
jgi:glyoxylase-like metal-dependent hydrolase (beta-lactamase superfamily II)